MPSFAEPFRGVEKRRSHGWAKALPVVMGVAVGVVFVAFTSPLGRAPLVEVTTCCPPFGVFNESHYPAGGIGCQAVAGEECFSLELFLNVGWKLSAFSFELLGTPTNQSNILSGTPIPLGSGAVVTVLNSGRVVVGVWDWLLHTWAVGASWSTSPGTNLTLVLDTDLQGIVFSADLFMVDAAPLGGGGVGTWLR